VRGRRLRGEIGEAAVSVCDWAGRENREEFRGGSQAQADGGVDDDRKSEDKTGAWRWRTGGRMT
ncbi:hypothetical protein HAX54_047308, partial [Datura stramonium]|nr:hypothetical protein [Datura stramonium]